MHLKWLISSLVYGHVVMNRKDFFLVKYHLSFFFCWISIILTLLPPGNVVLFLSLQLTNPKAISSILLPPSQTVVVVGHWNHQSAIQKAEFMSYLAIHLSSSSISFVFFYSFYRIDSATSLNLIDLMNREYWKSWSPENQAENKGGKEYKDLNVTVTRDLWRRVEICCLSWSSGGR